jgi:transcriptional regulator with XRE-family HTH domain
MAVPQTLTMSLPASDRRGYSKLAISIRSLRLRSGLSQRQLAGRMSVAARSYISKVENDACMPTLSSLERLARALDVSIPELLGGGDRSRQEEEVGELMKDEFIAQLAPFIVRLNALQMSGILLRIRNMTVRRRSA